jgi:hypothetical protein
VARGGGRVLPGAAHEGPRVDGGHGTREDVGHGSHGLHGS